MGKPQVLQLAHSKHQLQACCIPCTTSRLDHLHSAIHVQHWQFSMGAPEQPSCQRDALVHVKEANPAAFQLPQIMADHEAILHSCSLVPRLVVVAHKPSLLRDLSCCSELGGDLVANVIARSCAWAALLRILSTFQKHSFDRVSSLSGNQIQRHMSEINHMVTQQLVQPCLLAMPLSLVHLSCQKFGLTLALGRCRSAEYFVESMMAVLGLIVQNSSGPAVQAVVGSDVVMELFVCNMKQGTAQGRIAACTLLVGIAHKVCACGMITAAMQCPHPDGRGFCKLVKLCWQADIYIQC